MSLAALALAAAALPAPLVEALDSHTGVRAAGRAAAAAQASYEFQSALLFDPLLQASASHSDTERGGSFASEISGGSSSQSSTLSSSISWLSRRGFTLNLSLRDSRSATNSTLFGGESVSYNAQGTLSLTYPLDSLKREARFAGLDRAALAVVDSHLALEEARQQAAFEVVSAFWNCLLADANTEVRQASLEEAEQRELEVEARILAGTLPPSERASFRSQSLQISASLLEAEIQAALCRDQAALLFGHAVPPEWIEAVANLTFPSGEPTEPSAVARARLAVEVATVGLAEARAQDRADLDLSANYGLLGESDRHHLALETIQNPSWGVTITWSKRLGEGGLSEATSLISVQGSEEDLDRALDTHALQEDSLTGTLALRARSVEAAQAAVDAAQVAYEAVLARWSAGLTPSLDLFAAENRLLTARTDLFAAQSRHRVAQADLARYRHALLPAA